MKSLKKLIGRSIPVVGAALTVVEFKQNAEAHGVGGAIVRATPVLGDLVSVYDLAKEVAQNIEDEANAAADANLAAINDPVDEAWQKAREQTIAAYQELAAQIEVTTKISSELPGMPDEFYVDTQAVADALRIYCDEMQAANRLAAETPRRFNFQKTEADAKRTLRDRLIKAAQPVRAPERNRVI